jgi:hypothetical protein
MALKPPLWTVTDLAADDHDGNKALTAWVRQEIGRPENNDLREKYLLFDNPKGAWVDLSAAIQSAAVKAARNNDSQPLANLLDDKRERPQTFRDIDGNNRVNELGVRALKLLLIYPETRAYLAELIRKAPKRRGRASKSTTAAMRHDTLRYVQLVQIILQRQYSKQEPEVILARAIEVVAALRNLKAGTISNFLKNKPKAKPRT